MRTELRALAAVVLLVAGAACGGPEEGPPQAEPMGAPSFSLVVLGDFGAKTRVEEEISEAIELWVDSHGADAIVTTGDNVYPYGSQEFLEFSWARPFGWVDEDELPVYPTLGNHDVDADDGEAVMEYFDMPGRYYSVTFGNADVFLLDGTRASDAEQLAWLEDGLASSQARWQIAVTHFPPYSCSRKGGDAAALENFVPLFSEYGVDLVLSGHEHNYQRFLIDGDTYVITGGGGDDLYGIHEECEGPLPVAGNDTDYHYMVVEGNDSRIQLTAVALEGHTIDDYRIDGTPPR
jgi:3',5'-cyclic AMP phosphodiesterase CpdA